MTSGKSRAVRQRELVEDEGVVCLSSVGGDNGDGGCDQRPLSFHLIRTVVARMSHGISRMNLQVGQRYRFEATSLSRESYSSTQNNRPVSRFLQD